MKVVRTAVVLSLALLLAAPMQAEEKAKPKKKGQGGQNIAAQLLKSLADVELTKEQKEKIQAMGKEAMAEMSKVREEAGITPELTKKRAEAAKSVETEKKGKARQAAIDEAAGLTKEQSTAMAKMTELRQKFQKDAIGVLTAEQKEKLPQNLKRLAGQKEGKKPAKKKKSDN